MPAKTVKCFNYKISGDCYNKIIANNIFEWPRMCNSVLINYAPLY